MLSELQLDHASFNLWLYAERQDNQEDLKRVKQALPIVLNECVTEKQRIYMIKYFAEQMSVPEIAEIYGVDKSTVSKGIRRGMKNVYSYLRFVSPLFAKAPPPKNYLRNRLYDKRP